MSEDNRFIPSSEYDRYDGVTARTKQLEEELKVLEEEQTKIRNGEEASTEEPNQEDDFENAYSEVEVIAHDEKARRINTQWAQKRFNEAKKAREERDAARKEAAELRQKLAEQNAPKPSVPLEEWAQEYPESAAQVDARIYNSDLANQRAIDELRAEIERLKEEKEADRAAQEEIAASKALVGLVPDAMEIMTSPEFDDWLNTRPAFKDVIEGTLDVQAAAEVLKSYKYSKAASSPEEYKKKQEQAEIEAAAVSVKSSSNQPIDTKAPKIWKESEIKALSLKDYQKYEAEIDLAFAEGRYDPHS